MQGAVFIDPGTSKPGAVAEGGCATLRGHVVVSERFFFSFTLG